MTRSLLLTASAVLAGALALPGVASADPDTLAGADAGLTAPSGIVETPDGGLWIADEARGVCRIVPGAPAQVVESPWCGAGPHEEEEAPEPDHEDALPVAPIAPIDGAGTAIGPASVGGLAFDPQTDNFYASDRASSGGGVWRLHYDRESGAIDGGTQIVATADRVEALALGAAAEGAAPDLYYFTKRGGEIMRISNPDGEPGQPELVAGLGAAAPDVEGGVEAPEAELTGMAATADALYLADGGLKRLPLSGGVATPEPVAGFEDREVTAVAIDPAAGRLYAGTSTPELGEIVEVLDLETGAHEPYEQGFATVTALGVDGAGRVVVADDPSVESQFTVWQARLWRVPVQPLGRPQAHVTPGQAAVTAAAGASFSYSSHDAASFECRLDGGAFEPCPGVGSGRITYASLPEGQHRFSVRAKDALTGLYASVAFTLDRTAPKVTVIQPTNDYIEGGLAPRIRFSAFESGIRYTCSVDGRAFKACFSGNPVEGLTAGTHVLRVIATDEAGNASDPNAPGASAKIRVLARFTHGDPVPPPAEKNPTPATAAGTSAPAPTAPATAPVEHKPLLFPFTLRFKESPTKTRLLRFGLEAPGGSAELRVTVKDWRNRTVLTRVMKVRANALNRVDWRLTRAQQRRLRPGRYLVRAVLRTARGTEGNPQTHWLRIRRASR